MTRARLAVVRTRKRAASIVAASAGAGRSAGTICGKLLGIALLDQIVWTSEALFTRFATGASGPKEQLSRRLEE